MITRLKYRNTTWVDLNHPTADEIQSVMDEFHLNPVVANELSSPSIKSRVELHPKHLYLILHFPVFRHSHSDDIKQEVDFVIGKNFLITARYDTIDAIDKFQKLVEVNSILDRGFDEDSSGALFFGIVQEIYQSLFHEIEHIENWIGKIELDIFDGKEKEMVFALSDVSRMLLNFKKATSFHREVLKNLDTFGKQMFDEHFSYHAVRTIGEYNKLENSLRNLSDSVSELRETNNSLLSTKQNEIMKVLTIVTFIVSPLALIASLLQIETNTRPIVGGAHDAWIIYGGMVVLGLLMYFIFKLKRWL